MKNSYLSLCILFVAFGCSQPKPNESQDNLSNNKIEKPSEEAVKPTPKLKPMEYVVIETNKGKINLELDPNKAPITVANFLSYVDKGFYDGTIFHRVIPSFMIQGGGFTVDGKQKETESPIELESQNGLSNVVGSIAMARTGSPNSATCQFFINVGANESLDYRPGNPGYAVFGKVTSGMDVVNEIRQVKTGNHSGHGDWPVDPVIITKVTRE